MFITLCPTPIFEPCERYGCGQLDASGNVRLQDDTGSTAVWCRQCSGDLFKSLLARAEMIPVLSTAASVPPAKEVAA